MVYLGTLANFSLPTYSLRLNGDWPFVLQTQWWVLPIYHLSLWVDEERGETTGKRWIHKAKQVITEMGTFHPNIVLQ